MRKSVLFFVCFLVLIGVLLYIDYLKGTQYKVLHHGLFIHGKNMILFGGSVALAFGFMHRRAAKTFLLLYGSLWVVFYILHGVTKRWFSIESGEAFHASVGWYQQAVQLFTPFPILVFWIGYSVFSAVSKLEKATPKAASDSL